MSEKIRGSVVTSSSASAAGGCALIGAPTLISSTFSSSIATQPLTNILTTTAVTAMDAASAPCSSSSAGTSPNNTHLKTASTNMIAGTDMYATANTAITADLPAGLIASQLNFQLMPSADEMAHMADANSIMNSSQISAASNDSMQLSQNPAVAAICGAAATTATMAGQKHWIAQNAAGKSCRFPKLEECAHFHYERVQLGALSVRLLDDKSELLSSSIASQSIGGEVATAHSSLRSFSPNNSWFIIKVSPQRADNFLIKRSFENMQLFDEMLHRCVYDRKISGLRKLHEMEFKSEEDLEYAVDKYLERFSKIASDSLTCGTILTWLQLDNKGRRLPLADSDTMRSINTPAVGAAYGVRRYQAQASDEISIEVGDMISVIDMPSPAESIWWRGKKSHLQKSQYEVGFFPQSCVATIGDKVPRNFPMPAPIVGQLDVSPTKPVLRKHGKLIAFFRSFILSRPSRRRLKQSGIYRERVFSCDLSEHLLNSGQEIPMVLKVCADFIEQNGTVDGIYRLSGITSNIQRLRRAFDEERVPDLGNPEMKQDIHAVSSLLKMYFRELPNPLCTYQLYDNFVEAIQEKSESSERLRLMKETVLKLPPPHYRTLKYLAEHLNRISQHAEHTGMTDKNLAIVWAPNLLRSPALESGGVAALRGVGVQAVVTEYLIRNCYSIFDTLDDNNARLSYIATATANAAAAAELRMDSLTDCESLLVEQREHDQALNYALERPKSLSASGPKLISLEEAQERHLRLDGFDLKTSMPISMLANNAANIGNYIEVGGGPSSLPDKYHTVLSMPRNLQKRKPASWKSLFTRNQRAASNGANVAAAAGAHDIKLITERDVNDAQTHNFKQPAQVSFAELNTSGKGGKTLLKQEKPKSIELFDNLAAARAGDLPVKAMEVCVRSNSIDSLRTAGHSRSVSHDSYFDLLQSPQRGHMTNCTSRELSELGLNFDREEPEMRIFSESESLVSSPRVGKENVPPSASSTSRRIMRARPEEFSSQTNSVNPSPKKQPRLNLLLSPNADATQNQNWNQTAQTGANAEDMHDAQSQLSSDESCCKRYKLEDQLSDIQFIDCATPEHTIANTQTMYTSVQVHAPPKSTLSRSSLYGSRESSASGSKAESNTNPNDKMTLKNTLKSTESAGQMRYSYPSVQLGSKRKEQDLNNAANALKERFSYPGAALRYASKDASKMQVEEQQPRNVGSRTAVLPELLRARSRSSLAAGNNGTNDINKPAAAELERAKLCITPSSPMQSPRYSLLVADATSSENSSALNTPQYDLDPLMLTSAMSGLSGASSNLLQQQQLLLGIDATSHESLGSSNLTANQSGKNLNREQQMALKREMSLDLQPMTHANKQQLLPSPNNSNFTDNTSQSVTPSEFGYQHLQRQSSMHSLIETDENSAVYEDYEHTPSNLISPIGTQKAGSPIKSTISITYNLKSPKEESPKRLPPAKPKRGVLLETSFDEQTVYEQVKFFKNSVTEVNQLLHNAAAQQIVQEAAELADQQNELLAQPDSLEMPVTPVLNSEMNNGKEKLLYQNVQLRKPKSVYANMLGEQMKPETSAVAATSLVELDSLDSIKSQPATNETNESNTETAERKSPSNFSVKQLANKFESSPVDISAPAFDFSVRSSIRKYNAVAAQSTNSGHSTHSNQPLESKNTAATNKQLHKTTDITRSLDENAFVREFGANKHLPDYATARSTQQLPELTEVCSRRKSFDFTRPKTLNPPKRLPGMPIAEELCLKSDKPPPLKLQLPKDNCNFNRDSLNTNASSIENDYECTELKITPTTENRISLIQNNVLTADLNNSNTQQQQQQHSKVLSGVKLDRERIDRIKEERRQQLTQKYQTDSLKSRSKTDLNEMKFNADSLRLKSKSRTDMRSVASNGKDNDNLKDFTRASVVSLHAAGSESALHASNNTYTQRVRSISDEKNQNGDINVGVAGNMLISNNESVPKREEFSARVTVQKFERKNMDLANGSGSGGVGVLRLRDANAGNTGGTVTRNSVNTNREKISPQFSIRDVTAMFESRAHNQQ